MTLLLNGINQGCTSLPLNQSPQEALILQLLCYRPAAWLIHTFIIYQTCT
jgi:hypothetical protein